MAGNLSIQLKDGRKNIGKPIPLSKFEHCELTQDEVSYTNAKLVPYHLSIRVTETKKYKSKRYYQ